VLFVFLHTKISCHDWEPVIQMSDHSLPNTAPSAVPDVGVDAPFSVHPSSYVDEPSDIGEGTVIWHFCHIMPGSRIGRCCKIGQNVVVGPNVTIGNGVKIQNNVSVYPGVTLEDDVFCGPSVVFTNILTPRSAFARNSDEFFLKTRVCQGASIGANATIVCGITIGRYALVGAGSVVTRDIPDYALVYGNPAQQHGWACFCGSPLPPVVRPSETMIACVECQRAYQIQWQEPTDTKLAVFSACVLPLDPMTT
jgi:UDP-2-acetamido-3-amino-2,3-dideoxy-glucuronate N-acetyltransferase